MARMTKETAWNLAIRHGIDLKTDFHAKSSDEVESISEAMKEVRYRAPKNRNGSPARCFFAYMQRAYAKQD